MTSNDPETPLSIAAPQSARELALVTHFMRMQDLPRAMHYSRRVFASGEPAGMVNLLSALVLTQKFEAAAELGRICLVNEPHHSLRKAVLELMTPALYYLGARDGDCSEGYAAGHELASHANLHPDANRWEGQPLRDKVLLLTLFEGGLGGFGDHIMWARYIPLVADFGARIIVQCPQSLARLFATLPGVVATTSNYESRPSCDYAASIMELPHILRLGAVPASSLFRVPSVPFPGVAFNVGITWGSSWSVPHMDRSCALAEFLPISEVPSAALYSLQKGSHQKQLAGASAGFAVTDLSPSLMDFLDTAVAIASLDAVVTTDNVVANLSATLGRPTFVLVPKHADWRWGVGGRTAWYPTARVYQQDTIGDWAAPIARLAHDLLCFTQSGSRQEDRSAVRRNP